MSVKIIRVEEFLTYDEDGIMVNGIRVWFEYGGKIDYVDIRADKLTPLKIREEINKKIEIG